jgi:hypothetical protein
MSICIEIVRADGRIQRQMLAHERTTVGSSDQASVVVADAPELEPLHILLVPRDRGVWLSAARNARTPVLLDGKPFESGELGLGTEVDIGSITVRIATADDDGKAKRARNIVLLVVAAVVAVPFLGVRNGDMPPPASEPAPPLFAPVPSDCPAEGDAAELRGAQAVERAMSKTLRYPFDPREGLSAVELYRSALPCLAGSDLAEEAIRDEKQLRQRIEDDYQLMRLNLERALGEEDWKQAAAASSQLLALLADRPGAYRDWLLGVQRFLELRLSEQKEKSEKDGPL